MNPVSIPQFGTRWQIKTEKGVRLPVVKTLARKLRPIAEKHGVSVQVEKASKAIDIEYKGTELSEFRASQEFHEVLRAYGKPLTFQVSV